MENLNKKISLLRWLFLIQGIFFAIATISEILGIGTHGPYWVRLIETVFFFYIFLNINKPNNRHAYNLAMFFSGIAMIGTAGPLFFAIITKTPLDLLSLVSNFSILLAFGILPFSILVQSQVKKYYIPEEEKMLGPQVKSLSGTLFLIWLVFSPVLSIYLYAKFESYWITTFINPLILIVIIYLIGGIFLYVYFKKIGFWNKKIQ